MKLVNTDNQVCDTCGVMLDGRQAPDLHGFVFCSENCRALEKEMYADFKAHSEYVRKTAADPFDKRPSTNGDEI